MDLGNRHRQKLDSEITARKNSITTEKMATIVYTSGTTGPPKGCMISHENIVKVLASIDEMHNIDADTNLSLLVLPLSHFYPRVSGYYFNLFKGIPLALAESIDTFAENLVELKPTYFCCVPRILEKVYARIHNATEKGTAIQRMIFNWAMRVGRTKMQQEQTAGRQISLGLSFQSLIADRLVFKKIRDRLGGRLSFVVSAGAPLLAEVGEFVYCLGIKVIEFYGLSESLGGTMTTLDVCRYGTVGKPMPGFEVKLADDGEILIRGNNFMGYYNNPEKTKEVLKNNWCYTGDVGLFDDEGFLKIIDRKKDLIITSGGKNIAPQNLENIVISQISLVSNAMVYGDMKNYLTILLTLDPEAVKEFAEERGLISGNYEEILQHTKLTGYIQEQLDLVNSRLARFETLKKFVILPREFSMEDGEITPTLKLKRKAVKNKFKALMESLYQ
jgi:long-chain acyl-CoA synthetase